MKKRNKAIMIIGAGVLVYSIGIMMGVSFLNGDNSQKNQQNNIATSDPLHIPAEDTNKLSKWVAGIQPAAGEEK